MSQSFLKAGELADLVGTTKRAVHFYGEIGLLKPFCVNKAGYRFYSVEQIADLQTIMLLRHMNYPVDKIEKLFKKHGSYKNIFRDELPLIQKNIESIQRLSEQVKENYENIEERKLLVRPDNKKVDSFILYYLITNRIEDNWQKELLSKFLALPENINLVKIMQRRKRSNKIYCNKVGILFSNGVEINKKYKGEFKQRLIPDFKALSYAFSGSEEKFLKYYWDGLYESFEGKKYKSDIKVPFYFEVYSLEKKSAKRIELQIPVS